MRIEKDSIGALEIPIQAYYGINTFRTKINLSFSGKEMRDYPSFIYALAQVKQAAAIANFETGAISKEFLDAIVLSCQDVMSGRYNNQFIVDALHGGGGIGFNMNINEVLANIANEHLGFEKGSYSPISTSDHINASQSTSDVCHTAFRIALIKQSKYLLDVLELFNSVLLKKEKEFNTAITISRTCLQDAMPVYMGEKFSGYKSLFARRLQSLKSVIADLYQVNLGGTVIGSGTGAPEAYRNSVIAVLCKVTGLDLTLKSNLFDAAQNIDELARLSGELNLIATGLIKFAKDLRILSSGPEAGFGEIRLEAIQAGSSFFPGKINPVLPETIIQCGFQVIAHDRFVSSAYEHGELDLNVYESAACINIMDAISLLVNAIPVFTDKCVSSIQVNQERCKQLANSFIPTVVQLKELVGYSKATELLKNQDWESIHLLIERKGNQND